MISAQHLSKAYKSKHAVSDLSFTVETGKVTGFLGPNGAGKSTTMRLMLGLDKGEGMTLFDNKLLQTYEQPAKVVGILLEAKAFHPSRSAREHLRILAEAGGIPLKRADEVLEEVGLTSVARKSPGKFSLGMSQRLGLAAAILGEPKYLLLDEPANGLDPEGIAWLREFLRAYAERGNGVFVSSHLLAEMAHMADNVVVIGQGKLIADTSITALVDGNSHASVQVRVAAPTKLGALLKKQGITYAKDGASLVIGGGVTTDIIGKLAFEAGTPVLELTRRQASLEEAFLALTAESTEFKK